jgi:precorrin-6B methylase 2
MKILAYLRRNKTVFGTEGREIYTYLEKNKFSVFPYEWTKKYTMGGGITVYADELCGMNYVIHNNKRLYFKRGLDENAVRNYYNGLLIEQDMDSPHRYESGDFRVENGDVVVDIGAAEGNFALDVVERAGTVYLFEADAAWLPALEKTFEPWIEKVIIVNKFVSDTNDENTIRLDDYFAGKEVDFIKVDVEGAEARILKGAENLLRNSGHIKAAVCTYHRQHDAEEFEQTLKSMNFSTEFSRGYMIYHYDKFFRHPYLRRGLIRGVKK